MPDTRLYDVFLSYNSRDRTVVEQLACCLRDKAGLAVWFDEWRLIPGDDLQEELEKALDGSKSCAVLIGPSSLGAWQREEMRAAIQSRVEQQSCRVVPVILPGATFPERAKLPRFLSGLHKVDFRGAENLCEHRAFKLLVAGIRGVPPGQDEARVNPLRGECPYRGLEVFDEKHAELFFGREALTQYLIETLRPKSFLAVLGASGSGKSSLARAGLLPMLRRGALPLSDSWTYKIFKPGPRPLEALALELTPSGQTADDVKATQELIERFKSDETSLHIYSQRLLASEPEGARLFILIDQFEEVFHCNDAAEQSQFIKNLRFAVGVGGGRTIVTLTMRADFLARASGFTELAEMLSGNQFIVSPMDEIDIRRAIEEPARLAGFQFEKGLVNRILHDVKQASNPLPLLEDTLLQLCKYRSGDMMKLQNYEEIGGVLGSLAKRADVIFDRLTAQQQTIATGILLCLTQLGEGTEDTRRRAPLSELIAHHEPAEVEQVIKTLADERLLTVYAEAGKELQVDVAHEALIRGWPRLRRWIEEDRESIRAHRRLTEAARQWKENKQEESYLYRGARLEQAVEWKTLYGKPLSLFEQEFLDASIKLQEKVQRVARRRRRSILLAVTVFAAVVISILLLAYLQVQADESRRLARGVMSQLAPGKRGDPNSYYKVLNLAVEAVEFARTAEAEEALRGALVRGSHIDYVHPGRVVSAAFSPNGRSIVTAGEDNVARVWNVAEDFDASPVLESAPRLKLPCPTTIKGALYSRDGRLVLTIGDNKAHVWDAQTGKLLHSKIWHDEAFRAKFSPDSKRVVTASNDQTARVWDAETGDLLYSLPHADPVSDAEFSPDGRYILTVAGEAKLWDAKSYQSLRLLGPGSIMFAAFSRDGKAVVIVHSIDSSTAWSVDTGAPVPVDETRKNELVASGILYGDVTSDGRVVAGVYNGQATLRDALTNSDYTIGNEVENVPVLSAAFSPDDKLLLLVLSDRNDKAVRLYECDICGPFDDLLERAKRRVGRH